MSACCGDNYDCVFTAGEAEATAARYRRKGLRGSARDLVEGIASMDRRGLSILEIGGGIGDIQVELLERGIAGTSINVDLSHNWERPAQLLLSEKGLEGRVERVVGDFVEKADELAPADVVILHQVVCCYPDWHRLLTKAADHARQALAMTFPADHLLNKGLLVYENVLWRLRRRTFRAHLHSPDAMLKLLADKGFGLSLDRPGLVWRSIVARRS